MSPKTPLTSRPGVAPVCLVKVTLRDDLPRSPVADTTLGTTVDTNVPYLTFQPSYPRRFPPFVIPLVPRTRPTPCLLPVYYNRHSPTPCRMPFRSHPPFYPTQPSVTTSLPTPGPSEDSPVLPPTSLQRPVSTVLISEQGRKGRYLTINQRSLVSVALPSPSGGIQDSDGPHPPLPFLPGSLTDIPPPPRTLGRLLPRTSRVTSLSLTPTEETQVETHCTWGTLGRRSKEPWEAGPSSGSSPSRDSHTRDPSFQGPVPVGVEVRETRVRT